MPVDQLSEKENTWIFQAYQAFHLPVILSAPESTEAEDEPDTTSDASSDETPLSTALSRTVHVDTRTSLQAADHYFLDKPDILNQLKGCLRG